MSTQRLNKSGGYTTNERGAVFYSPSMDAVDNPNFIPLLQKTFMKTTSMDDYSCRKPQFATGSESYFGPNTLENSGYNRTPKALGIPNEVDVWASNMTNIKHAATANAKTNVTRNCSIPYNMSTEVKERYSHRPIPDCLSKQNVALKKTGATGYANELNPWNPVLASTVDPTFNYPKRFSQLAFSVNQTDYRPRKYSLGGEGGKSVTPYFMGNASGFPIHKELEFCFLPARRHYGKIDLCYDKDNISTYAYEYTWKDKRCDFSNCRLVGKPQSGVPLGEELNLFKNPKLPRITETHERFTNPWPLPGDRHMHQGFPIKEVSSSPFVVATKLHLPELTPDNMCGNTRMFTQNKMEQQKPGGFNPWPRALLGHGVLINPSHRPSKAQNVNYQEVVSTPTTGNHPTLHLA